MARTASLSRIVCSFVFLTGASFAHSQSQNAKQSMQTMVQREQEEAIRRGHYLYLSEERSDRTEGHLWTERVVETNWGMVRYLIAEDGKPLASDRVQTETHRLAQAAADPTEFKRQLQKADEDLHSQKMLVFLLRAFYFDDSSSNGRDIHLSFRPDPSYAPQTLEERALHSMTGTVIIDAETMRLREISGRVPKDVSLGFGPLATLHAGSEFSTTREHVAGTDWKTGRVHTSIQGRAFFVKTIAQQEDSKHGDFKLIASGITLDQAVALVEK